MKINKWLYGWKLYVDYGTGWEYENFEATYKEYRENKKAYAENHPYPQKWVRGRELNPDWERMVHPWKSIKNLKDIDEVDNPEQFMWKFNPKLDKWCPVEEQ